MAGKKAKAKARKAEAATANVGPEMQARAARLGPFTTTTSPPETKPSVLAKTKPKPGQAGDVFDVFMLKEAPGKGLGAFATCPIKFGAKVFTETPLIIIEKPPEEIQEEDVSQAYSKLTAQKQRVFDAMRNCHKDKGCECKMGRFFSSIFNLEDGWRRTGCFPICARFNHSCRPNIACASVNDEDRITFRAITDIAEGEELCFSYCVDFQYMTYAERTALLHTESRCFDCLCEVCMLSPEDRMISDMRRCIMRHLFYWIEGKDLYEAPPTIKTPHPRSKQDIFVEQELPYEYLLIMLAEAEGVRAGGMIPRSYMASITQIGYEVLLTGQTHLPRHQVKQLKQWLEIGYRLGRIHNGPEFRLMPSFARAKEFLSCVGEDGRIRWEKRMAARNFGKC